jgi:hypothetical protein
MKNSELKKLKSKLMEPDWTETLHHELEKLNPKDAKIIVESMTDEEIDGKVNARLHQQDYIVDYIEFLWEISETAFWRHVAISLDVESGILWGDHMPHLEKMCEVSIPNNVLKAVIDLVVRCEESNKQDLYAIGCVIRAQVKKFDRLGEINKYIESLDLDEQTIAKKRIPEMIKEEGDSFIW